MTETERLLDALQNAAKAGDFEAVAFLRMFAPWAMVCLQDARRDRLSKQDRCRILIRRGVTRIDDPVSLRAPGRLHQQTEH